MGANAHVLVRFCSWSKKKKWAATLIVSAFTFISPVSSSMMAPAGEQIAGEFGITNSSVIALLTSVFVAAYGESLAMTSCTWEALMTWDISSLWSSAPRSSQRVIRSLQGVAVSEPVVFRCVGTHCCLQCIA